METKTRQATVRIEANGVMRDIPIDYFLTDFNGVESAPSAKLYLVTRVAEPERFEIIDVVDETRARDEVWVHLTATNNLRLFFDQ